MPPTNSTTTRDAATPTGGDVRPAEVPLQTAARHAGFEQPAFPRRPAGSRSGLHSPLLRLAKRSVDVALAAAVATLAAPLMLAIAAAIRLNSPGPILFSQQRIGRGGRPIRVWKFRTMIPDAESRLEEWLREDSQLRLQWETRHKLADDPRVTGKIGRYLRATSLDELPQIWNVLWGEMSLVGPRPLPPDHHAQLDPRFRLLREQVLPGITGLWQISSRDNGSPESLVMWDTQYIEQWTIAGDLMILMKTIPAVCSRAGAS